MRYFHAVSFPRIGGDPNGIRKRFLDASCDALVERCCRLARARVNHVQRVTDEMHERRRKKTEEAFRSGANPGRHSCELEEDRSRRELLELLFPHVADAIFLAEPDGRIIDVNPAACAMLGFAREELLGMWPWDFVTSASREEILALIGSMKPGVPVSVQRTYRRKSGESRTMDLRLTRFGCPDRELIAASCRDLTEQVELELRLRNLEERRRIEEELRRLFSGGCLPAGLRIFTSTIDF